MTHPLIQGLNPAQAKATAVLSGPLLILAGAGSGKTRVLTHRIAHLIAHDIDASNILAVTFTNKAANEMKERITSLLNEQNLYQGRMPLVGTFHAICVRILRAEIEQLGRSFNRNFVIFDTDDAQRVIKIIMQELQVNDKEFKPKRISGLISAAKNQLISVDKFEEMFGHNRLTQVVAEIYPRYQKRLEEHNALDFDDLLQKTVELWQSNPTVLEKYQHRWQHVMIDEYQDTNFAQYKFMRLLVDGHQNIGVVGDDHQSIYSFRGADYRNILDFEKDFPDATVVKLEQNYRSSSRILQNANTLIGHNRTGRKKNLWTENNSGQKIQIHQVWDEKTEGNFIAEKIKELTNDLRRGGEGGGGNFSSKNEGPFTEKDIAVLYRTNAQSRALEEALMRNQIPYQIIGGTRFFDRREIKDIIAYLRLVFNPRDDVAFLRIINVPSRKLGPATIEVLKQYAGEYNLSLFEVLEYVQDIAELNTGKKTVLGTFYDFLQKLRHKHLSDPISILLQHLIDGTEYLKWLDDGTKEGENRQNNVRELFSVATRYDTSANSLADFLEGVALISDLDNHDNSQAAATLMTIHSSKGLEFPVVFLPGWEEGLFPGSQSQLDASQLEEERRLGYVAITRAEQICYITHTRQRMMYGQTNYSAPSKFLDELSEADVERHSDQTSHTTPSRLQRSRQPTTTFEHPLLKGSQSSGTRSAAVFQAPPKNKAEALWGDHANKTDYQVSQKVLHPEYGKGTIIQIQGGNLKIAFSGQGLKTLVADIAPLEIITE